jgi:hypothetical protein
VFANSVLRRTFGSKKDEVAEEWINLHSELLSDLYISLNIYRVIRSRRMNWAGHVGLWGRGEVHTWYWTGNLREIPFGSHGRR